MSVESNKAAIRQFFAAIDRAQSMAPRHQLAAPSYVAHFPGAPPMDREGTKGFGSGFYSACPGLRHTVDALVREGNDVAAQLTIRGTHTKPFVTPAGTIPAQGRPFALHVLNWYRLENDKVVEHRSVFDMMGFLQAIGAMPGPAAPAA